MEALGCVTNLVTVSGVVVTDFEFSHEVCGEYFYTVTILTGRESGRVDRVPLMFSGRIIDINRWILGQVIHVTGQFRSYNKYIDGKNRLLLHVFVKDFYLRREYERREEMLNSIFLDGYVCKKPMRRQIAGGRTIVEVILVVNRLYGRCDYLPCICFGNEAKQLEGVPVGTHLKVWGRLQSRHYYKKERGLIKEKEVYEITVNKVAMVGL